MGRGHIAIRSAAESLVFPGSHRKWQKTAPQAQNRALVMGRTLSCPDNTIGPINMGGGGKEVM